jgi:fatty-acyl-CoA synthase
VKSVWAEYDVSNPATGRTYRVSLRGWERGQSYCSCPDFRKNTLGTCKHVLRVIEQVKRKPGAKRVAPWKPETVEVWLSHQHGNVALRVNVPENLPASAVKILKPFEGKPVGDIHELVGTLKELDAGKIPYTVFSDAEEYIDTLLFRERIAKTVAEIRRDPASHPLRKTLLKTELLPYQLDGIAFAVGAGRAILADDMGLGKTIQGVGIAELLASEAGIRRGSAVTCLGGNTIEAYLVSGACNLIGARATNLHPMGATDDHAFIIEDCEAEFLIFDPASHGAQVADVARKAGAKVKLLATGPGDLAPDLMARSAAFTPQPLRCDARADDVGRIVYTGGTTGKPKGVVHTHRTTAMVAMTELAEWEWPDRPVFLAITPISHAAGSCILPALLRGGTVVLETGFTPEKFLDIVARHQVSSTFLVPTMIYKVLDHLHGAAASEMAKARSLQMVIYGAAPMAPARMREALQVFGSIFMQLYGQSEVPNCITVLRKDSHDPDAECLGSCGRAIGMSQVALLDDAGRPVGVGEVGEICVRGPLVMQGYWKRPDETEKAFRHGWLHTSDLAKQDKDGYFYIVGRSKDMIISGGFNVYPAEVEEVLSAHPAISAAAVIGVPDATWGEAVKAIVVLRPGQRASAEDLIAHVRAAKGPVHAPKTVEFIDSIPVTGLGKPDKKVLREQFGK